MPKECSGCKRKKKDRERFKRWEDYSRKKTYWFCSKCWAKAKTMRKKGIAIRSGLGIKKKPIKISKLKGMAKGKWSQRQRKELRQEVGKCEICGETKKLSVHHYKPKSQGGEDRRENYIVLCKGCHKSYHNEDEKN